MTYVSLIVAALVGIAVAAYSSKGPRDKQVDLTGAWQRENGSTREILILQDGYLTHTTVESNGNKFVQTNGGTFSTAGGKLSLLYEFDSQNKEQIGQRQSIPYSAKENQLVLEKKGAKEVWTRIDDSKAPLAGVWRITAQKREQGLVPIHQTGTRKTIKILTGTRFQWAAIDPGSKEFHGTGGGTYTFENGKYTENIDFFSRDNSRVGASLTFDGKLQDGNWHHSGLSSRGAPIYEVWSKVNGSTQ